MSFSVSKVRSLQGVARGQQLQPTDGDLGGLKFTCKLEWFTRDAVAEDGGHSSGPDFCFMERGEHVTQDKDTGPLHGIE